MGYKLGRGLQTGVSASVKPNARRMQRLPNDGYFSVPLEDDEASTD